MSDFYLPNGGSKTGASPAKGVDFLGGGGIADFYERTVSSNELYSQLNK